MIQVLRRPSPAPRWSRLAALTLGVALATAPATEALDLNGFFPAAGEGDLALSFTSESYDEFWVGNEKVAVPDIGEVETESLALWLRFGLTDRLALVANLPYVDVTTDGLAGFEDSGVQDLSALLAYRLWEAGGGSLDHRLVLAGGVRTPVGDYEGNAPVSLGDDTTDGLARLVYQLESGGFYFSQQLGYDYRGGDAPDGFPLYTELGYSWGAVTATAFYHRYIADGGTDIGDPGFTFPSNKDETERIGGKMFFRFADRFGAFAGAFSTLDGRNSGDTSGFFAGGVCSF